MKKVALADVLWKAANVRLSVNNSGDSETTNASCCAAFWAEYGYDWYTSSDFDFWPQAADVSAAIRFLESLGCETDNSSAFKAFPFGKQRQGVRYMWLLLAMHVAEDEGIFVKASDK